jgi:hypothetical protein
MAVRYIQGSTHVNIDTDTKLVIDINSRKGDMSMYSLAIEFYKRLESGEFEFKSIGEGKKLGKGLIPNFAKIKGITFTNKRLSNPSSKPRIT